MHFSDQFLDEVVARNDIADVVSSYVTLTRKGGNLFGLCPFHNEKTPSFSVAPDKQIYHCFGCGKGGNAVTFLDGLGGRLGVGGEQHVERSAVLDLCVEGTRGAVGHDELVARGLFIKRSKLLHRGREVGGNGDADFFGGSGAGKACEHEGGGKLLHLHDFFSMGGVEPH